MARRDKDRNTDAVVDESLTTWDLIRRFGPPAIVIVAAALFVLQNTDSVQFNYLWFDFRWPLWLMLVVFTAVGVVLFWLFARRRRARKRKAD